MIKAKKAMTTTAVNNMAVLLVAVIRSTRGPARKIHDINAILWISARIEMSAMAARHDPEKMETGFPKKVLLHQIPRAAIGSVLNHCL
jgi:hypothetical protein